MSQWKKRELVFVGSALKDLQKFPQAIKRKVGFDLDLVQGGETPATAKDLKELSGIMELVERYNKDTYRAAYVTNIGDFVFVLHCFKKKSKQGIKTPKQELKVIRQRLRQAQENSEFRQTHEQ